MRTTVIITDVDADAGAFTMLKCFNRFKSQYIYDISTKHIQRPGWDDFELAAEHCGPHPVTLRTPDGTPVMFSEYTEGHYDARGGYIFKKINSARSEKNVDNKYSRDYTHNPEKLKMDVPLLEMPVCLHSEMCTWL